MNEGEPSFADPVATPPEAALATGSIQGSAPADGDGRPRVETRRGLLLPAGLFLATLATTLWVGGALGIAAESPDLFRRAEGSMSWFAWTVLWVRHGVPYSFSLLCILLCHELGHYLTARAYRVDASLPYFLPMPFTIVGTLGAFIRIRSPFPDRRALLDVGLAGPIAGFLVCLPLLAAGVSGSRVGAPAVGGLQLGEPLAFQMFAAVFGPAVAEGEVLYLSPMGLAAWFGLLVTAINLLPIGQLDGGHALYAVFRERAFRWSRAAHLLMFPLAVWSPTWLIWGLLCLLLGARRPHPPTLDDSAPLDRRRRALAIVGLVVFVLSFTPEPVVMDWGMLFGS